MSLQLLYQPRNELSGELDRPLAVRFKGRSGERVQIGLICPYPDVGWVFHRLGRTRVRHNWRPAARDTLLNEFDVLDFCDFSAGAVVYRLTSQPNPPEGPGSRCRITVSDGDDSEEHFFDQTTLIGSGDTCDLQLHAPRGIEDEHVLVVRMGARWYLHDLTHPDTDDGRSRREPLPLTRAIEIVVGPYTLSFEPFEGKPPAPRQKPMPVESSIEEEHPLANVSMDYLSMDDASGMMRGSQVAEELVPGDRKAGPTYRYAKQLCQWLDGRYRGTKARPPKPPEGPSPATGWRKMSALFGKGDPLARMQDLYRKLERNPGAKPVLLELAEVFGESEFTDHHVFLLKHLCRIDERDPIPRRALARLNRRLAEREDVPAGWRLALLASAEKYARNAATLDPADLEMPDLLRDIEVERTLLVGGYSDDSEH